MAVIELLGVGDAAGELVAVPPGYYEVEALGVRSGGVTVQHLGQDGSTWMDTGVAFTSDGVDDLVVPSGTKGLRGVATVPGALVSLKPVRGVGG